MSPAVDSSTMTGRYGMKHFVCSSLLLVGLLLGARYAQSAADDTLPNAYKPAIENWVQMPEGKKWGEVAGESFDSKGHLWIVERCGGVSCIGSDDAPIQELDPVSGRVLKRFGAGLFVVPHSIFVDRKDADNIWAVDQSAQDGKGEEVWKFSPDGKVLMTLGKAGITGDGPDTFNDPTGVVTGSDGSIFVSDGHQGRNQTVARIVKFSRDGKFLKSWGKKGSDPGDLNDPHSITIDAQGRLFVADRGNLRIAIFDQDGKLLDIWKQFGVPSGISVDDRDTLYVAQNFLRPEVPDFKRGIRIGSARDGRVTAFIPDPDQDPKDVKIGAESVTADKDGCLYAGETDRREVKKYVLK
jgi:hypothetical protein